MERTNVELYETFYKEYKKGGKQLTDNNRKIVKQALETFDKWSNHFIERFDAHMQSSFIKPQSNGTDTDWNTNNYNEQTDWVKSLTHENVIAIVINKWYDCLTESLARVEGISPYGHELRKAGRIVYRRMNEGKLVTKAAVDKINNVIRQLPTEK